MSETAMGAAGSVPEVETLGSIAHRNARSSETEGVNRGRIPPHVETGPSLPGRVLHG